jgi:hypothetical protein
MKSLFIPLGEECYTCQSIDVKFNSANLRNAGFPFDYVGHVFIEKIYENLYDLFNNNFDLKVDDFDIQKFGDDFYFVHKKYDFKYWHDSKCRDGIFLKKDCDIFIEKYNRRYNRLYDAIKKSSVPIVFLSVNHFDNIYNKITKQSEIYKLFDLLHSYNNNIKLIAVNYCVELNSNPNPNPIPNPNLKFINLPVNYDLQFAESKIIFTESLYKYISEIRDNN